MSSPLTKALLIRRLNDLEYGQPPDVTTYRQLLKKGTESLITKKTFPCKYLNTPCSRTNEQQPCRFNHSEECAILAANVLKSLQAQLALTQFEDNYRVSQIANCTILSDARSFYEQELLNTQMAVVQEKAKLCETPHPDQKSFLNCPFNHIEDLTDIAQKVLQTRTAPLSLERNTSQSSELERVVRIATEDLIDPSLI